MAKSRARIMIDGIPVYCKHTRIMPIGEVQRHPQNPNKHPQKQIEVLAKIIKGNGWRLPCTVSKRSGFLTRGEGRFLAAQHLGLSAIPVDEQDYVDEDAEVSDLIADNVAPELSVIEEDILQDLITTLDSRGCDLSATGLDSDQLTQLIEPVECGALTTAPPLSEKPSKRERQQVIITYKDPDEYQALLDYLGIDGSKRVYSATSILKKRSLAVG
jgi:ParB-like chromosome segregation protein Spo0J